MVPNKLSSKTRALTWVIFVATTLFRNAYLIYFLVNTTAIESRADVLSLIVDIILNAIIIPVALCFIAALLVYQLGYTRYVRCISRSDFIHYVLMFSAAVRFVLGAIDIFSILEYQINAFTSGPLNTLLLTGAMLLMFFFIARRYNFNPVEKSNAFSMWATLYMVVLGLEILGQGILAYLASDPSSPEMVELLIQLQLAPPSRIEIAALITDAVIYGAYLVAVIVIGVLLRKSALAFRNPETRAQFYTDAGQTNTRDGVEQNFPDLFENGDSSDDNDKDDNIFDEFDL